MRMSRIKYYLLLQVLLAILANHTHAQLADDSLKKLIGLRYEQSLNHSATAEEIIGGRYYGNAYEVFKGYFPHIKIFSFLPGRSAINGNKVTCELCPKRHFAVYVKSGEPVDVENPPAFNRLMTRSDIAFTNTDKAYCYLILNDMANGFLISPEQYRKALFKGSVLLESKDFYDWDFWSYNKFARVQYGFKYDERRQHYLDASNRSVFYIGVANDVNGEKQMIIHQFKFDDRNRLTSHVMFPDDENSWTENGI